MAKNGASFQQPRSGSQICDSVDCEGGDTAKGGMAGGMKPSTPMKHPVPPMGGAVPSHPGMKNA